jgi:hypothetical protein
MVNILSRELESLRKWALSYSKTEKYRRDQIEAWTSQ